MTTPKPARSRTQSVVYGVALLVVPTLLAIVLLIAALESTSLALVWASIVVSVIALPAFVAGIMVLVRSSR